MSGGFQLLFSHLFLLSFVPAAVAGSLNARFRQRSACWVWVLPTMLLTFAVLRYPHSLLGKSHPGIEHYFGDVSIPEFRSFEEMAHYLGPWTSSFVDQLNYTAPFYAGIGYALAAWISMRWRFYSLGQQEAEVE